MSSYEAECFPEGGRGWFKDVLGPRCLHLDTGEVAASRLMLTLPTICCIDIDILILLCIDVFMCMHIRSAVFIVIPTAERRMVHGSRIIVSSPFSFFLSHFIH